MKTVAEKLADALRAILEQRDYHAEHGSYRPGTMGDDQCFDDWAADIAETVLAAYDAQQAQPVPAGAWSANAGSVWDHTGRWIADCDSEHAARIAACVNACQGMTLAEIESFGSPGELGRCAQLWASDDGEEVTP